MMYRTTGSQPIFAIRREIDRLFDDTFGGAAIGRGSWVPTVDVREDRDSYRFELELPGVDPSTVEVTADQGVLTVRGEKRQRREREAEDGRMHVTERTFGAFSRAFQRPQGVNDEGIAAEFDNGLLSVRVPKRARPEPRRIRIDTPVAERIGAAGDGASGNGSTEGAAAGGATGNRLAGGQGSAGGNEGRGDGAEPAPTRARGGRAETAGTAR